MNSSFTASGLARLFDGDSASVSSDSRKRERMRSSWSRLLSSIQACNCFCKAR
ncbi:hypothetical protein D3C76_1878050 [compost metagenome]